MKQPLLYLRPTQFAVGMLEVLRKVNKLKPLKETELREYLKLRPVPVVLGPGKLPFIIDHHHLARACWELGLDSMVTEVRADLSHLKFAEFWDVMHKSKWSHLFDQFGNGPHEPHYLPESIRGLADDPYRSLAWAVRREGGYEKSDHPFAEFLWADYLRKKITIEHGDDSFKTALKKALEFCRHQDCNKLPGYKKE